MLQFWSVILMEGQTFLVFNTGVVRKLSCNICVKWWEGWLNCITDLEQILIERFALIKWWLAALKDAVKRHKNCCWREKKGKYLVDLGIGRNVECIYTLYCEFRFPTSSSSKLELMNGVSTCASIFLNLYMIRCRWHRHWSRVTRERSCARKQLIWPVKQCH